MGGGGVRGGGGLGWRRGGWVWWGEVWVRGEGGGGRGLTSKHVITKVVCCLASVHTKHHNDVTLQYVENWLFETIL